MLNEVRVCSVESGSSLLAQRDLKVVNKAIPVEVNKLKEIWFRQLNVAQKYLKFEL